jgi:guanylate kinase
MHHNASKGTLIVFSGPSGAGKDTIIRGLLKKFPRSTKLVTTTTREKRPEDKEGKTYYFVSVEEFKNLIQQDAFVEYNIFNKNYYGIQKNHLQEFLSSYSFVFAQIDIHGREHLTELHIPHTSFFILPDNLEVLKKHALNRGGMTEQIIEERLQIAKEEIKHAAEFDYQIINHEGKINETTDIIASIIMSAISAIK